MMYTLAIISIPARWVPQSHTWKGLFSMTTVLKYTLLSRAFITEAGPQFQSLRKIPVDSFSPVYACMRVQPHDPHPECSLAINTSRLCHLARCLCCQADHLWSLLLPRGLIPEAAAGRHDTDQVLCWAFDSDSCRCIGIFLYSPQAKQVTSVSQSTPRVFLSVSLSSCVLLTPLPGFC